MHQIPLLRIYFVLLLSNQCGMISKSDSITNYSLKHVIQQKKLNTFKLFEAKMTIFWSVGYRVYFCVHICLTFP
jgi:predicted proteasome-type protease